MPTKPSDNSNSCRARARTALLPRSRKGRAPAPAERLEAAARLAGWFAHQINNPLGAISGSAQLLGKRLQRDIADCEALAAYTRYLEEIQSQAERCARITGEMLDFTQPGEPDLRRIDVLEVIAHAVNLARYAHPEARMEIADKGAAPPVRADREWLVRAVFEVLSNAAQASESRPVKIEARNSGARLQVRIEDSGPGISDDVLPRIFDPFFSTRDKARGMGLTLALEMMRKMAGSLKVEKTDPAGSVFMFEIPLWRPHD